MKYSLVLLCVFCAFSSAICSIRSSSRLLPTKQSWKDKEIIDSIVEKDPKEIYRIYGAVKTLEKLNNTLDKSTYDATMLENRRALSKHLGYSVESNQEMNEILEFFVSTGGISTSDKVKAMFTFANILLVIAIIITVIALGSVVTIWIVPLIVNLPVFTKIILFYALSALIIAGAFFSPANHSTYVGFLGALAFGGAYLYHLSTMERQQKVPAGIFIPPLIVWSALAILLQSRLIGFVTVMDFAAFIGFGFWIGPLCVAIGFDDKDQAAHALFPSAVLIGIYVAKALGAFGGITYFMDPFDAGAFFIGTFVYFTALLVLSSKYVGYDKIVYTNILAIASGLAVCALGFLVNDLAVFRGVGMTFFVVYLLQKYIEIPWGSCWSCGLLGGGVILILLGFAIKEYGTYFVFWNY